MNKQILFIVTSHDSMGESAKKTGVWAEELTKPYSMFQEAGYNIDIYSPKGGNIIFDSNSIKPKGENEKTVEDFLMHNIQAKSINDLIEIDHYDAIFIPGGHGAMWDLAFDDKTAEVITKANSDNKIIAAVCHGVAGLVNAKNEENEPLVMNKTINSFTDEEEKAAGLDGIVPFKLESKLKELGANFEKAENWQAFSVQDGNLITGQNPSSSEVVAQKVIASLN